MTRYGNFFVSIRLFFFVCFFFVEFKFMTFYFFYLLFFDAAQMDCRLERIFFQKMHVKWSEFYTLELCSVFMWRISFVYFSSSYFFFWFGRCHSVWVEMIREAAPVFGFCNSMRWNIHRSNIQMTRVL